MDTPLVTVNILSFNRKDDLRITLQKVFEQDYKNIEVIVVDNASSDGTVEMVRNEFPSVHLISMPKNIGIAGWNEGFKAAKGEYVLVLDDDSYPNKNTILEGINEFEKGITIGIISFNVFNLRIQKSETDDFLQPPYFFNGCGAMIKKSVIESIGYYNERYFLYYNELDYSARCYNAGFQIRYLSKVTVSHTQSLKSRGKIAEDPFLSEYRYYYYYLSYSIFLIQNFEFISTITYLLKYTLNRLLICIFYGYYKSFLKGTWFWVTNLKLLRRGHKLLNKDVQRFYRNGNIAFIDREYFPHIK
ncbi:MAG: glycosyltransferase family 2 protein [Bacteroidota bacterium]|jgi:hypothetical protein